MILTNLKIYAQDGLIENGWLEIENGIIKDYGNGHKDGIDYKNKIIVPGFIDQHFHGVNGYDLMTCDKEGLHQISKKILEYGVTSYLPTTLTEDLDTIKNVLEKVANYMDENTTKTEAKILGIHLEGPFLNNKFCGAQDSKYIIDPSVKIFEELQSCAKGKVKMVTYALEKGEKNFTKYLATNNVIPSVGHSGATFKEVETAVKQGLKCVTHFHNASSAYHHRNPGVVNAGLYFDDLFVEVIADGNHINNDVIKLIKKVKTSKRINLITDSSSATGLENGKYKLGKQVIIKKENIVSLENGVLAGSALKMCAAFKHMLDHTDSTIYEIIDMISINPSILIGIDNKKGSILKGKDADLVILDQDFTVDETIVNGKLGYKRGL